MEKTEVILQNVYRLLFTYLPICQPVYLLLSVTVQGLVINDKTLHLGVGGSTQHTNETSVDGIDLESSLLGSGIQLNTVPF